MKLSYIVTVYNSIRYLRETLDSLLAQTWEEYEIVVVDDGSVDGSLQVCDEYVMKYKGKIRCVHQKNQGQIISRLNGLKYICGDYVCFIDSDDIVDDMHSQEVMNVLDGSNIDVLYYGFQNIYSTGEMFYRKLVAEFDEGYIDKDTFMKKWLVCGHLNPLWRKVVKVELMENVPDSFRRRIITGGDAYISLPVLSRATNIYYLDKVLLYYRVNKFSISNNYKKGTWKSDEIVLEAKYKYFKEYFKDDKNFDELFYLEQMPTLWKNIRNISSRYKRGDERIKLLEEMWEQPVVKCMGQFYSKYSTKKVIKNALNNFYWKNWRGVFANVWLYNHSIYVLDSIYNGLKQAYMKFKAKLN